MLANSCWLLTKENQFLSFTRWRHFVLNTEYKCSYLTCSEQHVIEVCQKNCANWCRCVKDVDIRMQWPHLILDVKN